jgi:hypothetical protein
MAYVPVPNTLQANVRFVLDGQQIENVLNFLFPAGTFTESSADIYDALNTAFWAVLRTQLSNQLVSTEVYMVDLTSNTGATATFPAFTSPSGNITATAESNQVAFCITHRTANRGRSFRGRTYISGLAKTNITQNTVDLSVANGLRDAFNDFRDLMQVAGTPLVVVSRKANGVDRTTGLATPITESLYRDRFVDSQRRRAPGRGT